MKKRNDLSLLFILVFFVFANVMKVNAVNTGFDTNQLSRDKKNIFISNINILPIDEEPAKNTIECFDVNSNRLIAIGQNTSSRKTICIYSDKGVFQYGYTFNCSGDFGVEWDEENLNIYFARSSVIVSVTPNGEVVDVLEVPNTVKNNSYMNHFIHSTKRTVGDTEYSIRNDLGILNWFAASYSQVVVKDCTGADSVIYDVGSMQLSRIIIVIAIACVFAFASFVVLARQFIKLRSGN